MRYKLDLSSVKVLHRFMLVLLFSLLPAFCRAQVVGGTISGAVTDGAGATLAGASVTIRNEETGNARRLTTGADGTYAAPSIPVGRYSVIVSAEGFAEQTRSGVGLTVGQAVRVNVTLNVGTVAEQVTVTDTPAVVNASTEQTSGLVSR